MWSKRNFLYHSEKYGPMLYVGNSNSFIKLDENSFKEIKNYLFDNMEIF